MFRDHARTLYDLLEVRELLEGQAAYFSALRGNDADRYRITKAFEAMESTENSARSTPSSCESVRLMG